MAQQLLSPWNWTLDSLNLELLTLFNCSQQGSEDSGNENELDEVDDKSSDCESFADKVRTFLLLRKK